ncbi:MAG: NAD-dependent epimerase/dehydratase family protein, partial [Spirochaetales bacterium]|nr:NAD-dependent epimerase/dehydratase family protein [Spirochaetales bacterium]
MDILVLGGTQFVGRHIVHALLDAGHTPTLFSRGKTNTDLFPRVARLVGDRNDDLSQIEEAVADRAASGRSFDACIDVSAFTRNHILRSLDAVGSHIGRYLLISSISVYTVPQTPFFDEEATVERIDDPNADLSAATYGGLKVVCEREVEGAFGEDAIVFRLGLVNGPFDHTDRATYWAVRGSSGGEMFVPAGPDRPFQIVDGRDVGRAAVHALSNELSGAYNIVGESTTWKGWLDAAASTRGASGGGDVRVYADDQEWVEAQLDALPQPPEEEARPMGALPMFLPRRSGWEFWQVGNTRSIAAGITYRPYRETVADTLSWRRSTA